MDQYPHPVPNAQFLGRFPPLEQCPWFAGAASRFVSLAPVGGLVLLLMLLLRRLLRPPVKRPDADEGGHAQHGVGEEEELVPRHALPHLVEVLHPGRALQGWRVGPVLTL